MMRTIQYDRGRVFKSFFRFRSKIVFTRNKMSNRLSDNISHLNVLYYKISEKVSNKCMINLILLPDHDQEPLL